MGKKIRKIIISNLRELTVLHNLTLKLIYSVFEEKPLQEFHVILQSS